MWFKNMIHIYIYKKYFSSEGKGIIKAPRLIEDSWNYNTHKYHISSEYSFYILPYQSLQNRKGVFVYSHISLTFKYLIWNPIILVQKDSSSVIIRSSASWHHWGFVLNDMLRWFKSHAICFGGSSRPTLVSKQSSNVVFYFKFFKFLYE